MGSEGDHGVIYLAIPILVVVAFWAMIFWLTK